MKIGMVCYPSFGGSGVVATELGAELARRGHGVHFISYDPPGRLAGNEEDVRYHEVSISTYPLFKYPPYLLAMATKLAETVEMEELDLLHVHYAIPHTISATLAQDMLPDRAVPVVTTLHGTDITLVGRQPAFSRLVKYALQKSTGLTAVSRSLAADTREIFAFDGPISMIPNFVDTERFCRDAGRDEREKYASPEEKIIIHVSNFRPVKNTRDVIRTFARISQEIPARLLMLGDGPDLAPCVQLAAELGASEMVQFLAETPRVERILACADLFLLPSSQESFGLAALEAMSCSVPVLAYRVGGVPEVVVEGETGLLLAAGDWEGMAKAGIDLLKDRKRHRAMMAGARERVLGSFTPARVVPLYEALYREMC